MTSGDSATAHIEGPFRYSLTRRRLLLGGSGDVVFVMLNPSTADATHDDPTIRRCFDFMVQLGGARLVVVNLFAFRATDPKALWTAQAAGADVVGPRNDSAIFGAAVGARVIVAWGAIPASAEARARDVFAILERHARTVEALATTKGGQPRHPLYLPRKSRPTAWRPPA